jgi:prepilin-type processing-associated H-X9-DG protein
MKAIGNHRCFNCAAAYTLVSEITVEPKRRLTRTELVVGIGAVLICIALVVPLLRNQGETRRRAICLNNIKQIGLAMRLYSGDCREAFPTDPGRTTLGSFGLLTNNFQTSYEAWICPSDPGVVAGNRRKPFTSANLSYAFGAFGFTEVAQPDTPLACDRSSQGDPIGATPWANNQWTHRSDGGSVLFADGHVEFRKIMVPPMYNAKNP